MENPQQPPEDRESGPQTVHVLFVHGVGRHSRLSSLFRAFQSLRSFVRSPEAPLEFEDPFPDWRVADFNDASNPVYLKLEPNPGSDPGGAEEVYLYEVNYSAIAGVVRENQPLDLTHLLVSLDLAINVGKHRLRAEISGRTQKKRDAMELERHLRIARVAQKLTGVFVATTVPVLGLPSLLLRRYIAPIVAEFTRFFEDVATFALDRNGQALVSAHVDHTIQTIAREMMKHRVYGKSAEFIVVAHSLGTVVMHNFLVKNWGTECIPHKIITLGSPIGTICWMWRFLDFPSLRFSAQVGERYDLPYFCWKPLDPPPVGERKLEWINVVNHLDPIATVFPISDVFLAMPEANIRAQLKNGEVRQHFIASGGFMSVGASHTEYFDDKNNFLALLGKAIHLVAAWKPDPPSAERVFHWRYANVHLFIWQWFLWLSGAAAAAGYFWLLARIFETDPPWALLPLYVFPPLTIGGLAFCQRLLRGGPTKRSLLKTIDEHLPLWDWRSLPYRISRVWRRRDWPLEKKRPSAAHRFGAQVISFVPTLFAMIAPLWWVGWRWAEFDFAKENAIGLLGLVAVFMIYTVLFAGSEIARHWRKALAAVGALHLRCP